MGLLTSLLTGAPLAGTGTPGPDADFWYSPVGGLSKTGVRMTDEIALTVGAVFACVNKLAKSIEVAPAILYEDLGEDADRRPLGTRRAKELPLYPLLHDQPNARQTAPEFWGQAMAHLAMRGTFTARKIFSGAEVVELDPIHPDRVEVKILPNRRRGFMIRLETGGKEALTQDEVFHVIGLSLDGGKTGVSVIRYGMETFGLARATEDYAARLFGQGALHRGVVSHPGQLSPSAMKNLKQSIVERVSGAAHWHQPLVLEEGMKWEDITMTAEDAQLLLSRRFTIAEVSRWFDVPLVLLNETDRVTSWGSGIEQIMLGYVLFGVLPWCKRIEAAIRRDLIPAEAQRRFHAEFLLDALLRGDTKTRADSEALWIQNGIMSENEVRLKENLPPWPGLWEPQRSVNQGRGGGSANGPQPGNAPPDPPPPEGVQEPALARARRGLALVAGGAVRKETAAIRKWAPRHATDRQAWTRWVTAFYGRHVDDLVDRLGLEVGAARRYGAAHCAALLADGLDVLDEWDREAPAQLAALALGGRDG